MAEEKKTQTVAKTPQVEALDSAASEEEKPPPTPGSCSLLGLRTSWTSEPLTEITRTDTELALERAVQSAFW